MDEHQEFERDWTNTPWAEHQEFERHWHGDCLNTFSEEAKQITYAHRMGLVNTPNGYTGRWPEYDVEGRSVLDIGGGPTSLLLKATNRGRAMVVDPCPYPRWTLARYAAAGISVVVEPAETFVTREKFDEVWIYNVLQHVEDPAAVLNTAKAHGRVLRLFEWIDTEPTLGHPHMLTVEFFDEVLGRRGTIEAVNENSAVGKAYHGVFVL